ncbi:MAG: hypothetical protein Q9185_001064 [Variospora sp. 1 TL-2023]
MLILDPYRSNVRDRRCDRFTPAQLDADDLTHVNFAYVGIDRNNFSIIPTHPDDVNLYKEFTARKGATLQTWVVVGGFGINNPNNPTQPTWATLTSRNDWRTMFVTSLASFMEYYGFQGVDLDWEYPLAGDQAANFVALVREMRNTWNNKYGISVTLPSNSGLLGSFNLKGMEPWVDFFNFMSHDLIGPDEPAIGTSAVVRPHTDIRWIASETVPLRQSQLNAKKINLVLSYFGRGYSVDPKCANPGCPIKGASKQGPCTNSAGILSNPEINNIISQKRLIPDVVPDTLSKSIRWDDQWIGYDDEVTMSWKTDWAAQHCFGVALLHLFHYQSHWALRRQLKSTVQPHLLNLDVQVVPRVYLYLGKLLSLVLQAFLLRQIPQSPRSTASSQSTLSTTSTLVSAEAVTLTDIATIPAPSIFPGSLEVAGVAAVLGLIPLAIAIQKALAHVQRDITMLQVDSPKLDDAKHALAILAGGYASLQLLNTEIGMIATSSLPEETKKVIENVKKSLPRIQSGAKDTITDLTNAIKNPNKINKDDLRKADDKLGRQGSITQQVTPALKPLTDWNPPKGFNDINLSGVLSFPTPSLGDNWKGLVSLAKQAEGAVSGAARSMSGLSGRSNIGASDISNVIGQLTSAVQDVGGLGAELAEIELDTFPPADIGRVVEIQNTNRALFTELKSTLTDIAKFINRPPQALQALKKHAPAFVIGGTVLGLLAKSDSHSIDALPKFKDPQASNRTEPEDEADDWFFTTIPGTTVEAFEKLIRSLPDKGAGPQEHYDWPQRYQTYVAHMTREVAEAVNRNAIVGEITLNRIDIVWADVATNNPGAKSGKRRNRSRSVSNGTNLVERVDPTWSVTTQEPSDLHLRMLSCRPEFPLGYLDVDLGFPAELQDPTLKYMYEENEGQGAIVYVIDDDFRLTHQEFAVREAPANEFQGALQPVNLLSNSYKHGDAVAAMAVGFYSGAAKRAKLVTIRLERPEGGYTAQNLYAAFRNVVTDVAAQRPEADGRMVTRIGKSVVNFSGSISYHIPMVHNQHINYQRWGLTAPETSDIMLQLLYDIWMADIVTVFAFNRVPYLTMGEQSPQRYANPNNPIIVVGVVNRIGTKADDLNIPIGAAADAQGRDLQLVGDYTVYALGRGVDTIRADTYGETVQTDSPGLASPQIAGLAAYLLTLPGSTYTPGLVAKTLKDVIAGQRRTRPRSADSLDIAYNGVHRFLPCAPPPAVHPKSRRWLSDTSSISSYFAKILRRKESKSETVIAENGQFKDPKYSDASKSTVASSTSSTTSMSSTSTTAAPGPPAPPPSPTTITSALATPYPEAKNIKCYSKDKKSKDSTEFTMAEMNDFINKRCERFDDQRSKVKRQQEVFAMTRNGEMSTKLKMVFEKGCQKERTASK